MAPAKKTAKAKTVKAKTTKVATAKSKTAKVKPAKAKSANVKSANAKVAKTKTAPASKTEKLFFGQPNRIWRGRVLSVIANRGRTRLGSIMSILSELYGRDSKEKALFTEYLDKVLRELRREGFLQSDKKWYSLKS